MTSSNRITVALGRRRRVLPEPALSSADQSGHQAAVTQYASSSRVRTTTAADDSLAILSVAIAAREIRSGLPIHEQQIRELAVEQIGRKRRFRMRAFGAAVVGVVLVVIWAISEYHNAGGWPTSGFS